MQVRINIYYITGIDLWTLPSMKFEEERCDWQLIFQKKILGSCLPIIPKTRTPEMRKLKRQSTFKRCDEDLGTLLSSLKDKSIPNSHAAKRLIKTQNAQLLEEQQKESRLEKEYRSTYRKNQIKEKLKCGNLFKIYHPGQVF
jgi:hypothetical protein